MKARDLLIVIVYIILHLVISGPMNYLLFLKNTTDFFDIPVFFSLGSIYKILLAFGFLKVQRIQTIYILPIIALAFITRVVFQGPFPVGILAGWFFLYSRGRSEKV